MKDWTEEDLEKFIKENRDKLIKSKPTAGHEIKFMTKLQLRVKSFIDLTPYLVKVVIVTIIVFLCSMFVWYSFMRPDKNKPIIKNIIEQFEKKK
jgi:hypothetical protein